MQEPVVILGAGLAGLSLAAALARRGVGPLVVVDRRTRWSDDRTWCTWLTGPLALADLARARWCSWELARDRDRVVHRSTRHPYVCLPAAAVYARLLTELEAHPELTLRTGERVRDVTPDPRRPQVTTDRETFSARLVIDALGPRSPLLGPARAPAPELEQRFLGWEVEFDAAVLDPDRATLMDIRSAGRHGMDFMYRLPFSTTRALIEHTTIGRPGHGPTAAARAHLLAAEAARLGGGAAWRVRRREPGLIPMSAREHPARHGPGVLTAGGAAGAIRPSSGYAYTRILRHVTALADAIAAGREPPARVGPARLAALDRVFLTAAGRAPDGGAGLLLASARGLGADGFARFMTDVPTPRDQARLLTALPPGRMLGAALRAGWPG